MHMLISQGHCMVMKKSLGLWKPVYRHISFCWCTVFNFPINIQIKGKWEHIHFQLRKFSKVSGLHNVGTNKCFIITVGEKESEQWFTSHAGSRGQAIHIIAPVGGKRESNIQRHQAGPSIAVSFGDFYDDCCFGGSCYFQMLWHSTLKRTWGDSKML